MGQGSKDRKDFVIGVDLRLSDQMELWIKFLKHRLNPDISVRYIHSERIQSL